MSQVHPLVHSVGRTFRNGRWHVVSDEKRIDNLLLPEGEVVRGAAHVAAADHRFRTEAGAGASHHAATDQLYERDVHGGKTEHRRVGTVGSRSDCMAIG